MKKVLFTIMFAAVLSCVGCSTEKNISSEQAENTKAEKRDAITLKIASDYSKTEPIGEALEKWAQLVNERGDGSLEIKVYPDSQLGGKVDIIDACLMGEPDVVLADPAFMAEYGASDLGILFGPFLFESSEDCKKLTESTWYEEQCKKLEEKGLKVVDSTWITGVRHLLTNSPVKHPNDLVGMKIRVPANQIQTESFRVLGASPTAMNLSEVYTALQTRTIDGGENPLSTLYNRRFQEISKYLCKTGHVYVISMCVMSADVWNRMTPEQQKLMKSTLAEVGMEYNKIQEQADLDYEKKFVDEGVAITTLSDTERQEWVEASAPFYDKGVEFGWSEGLYETVLNAMGK